MNTIEDKATARPWVVNRIDADTYHIHGHTIKAKGGHILGLYPGSSDEREQTRENAKLIVKAVNSHETLIASIQKVAEIRRSILFVLSSSQFPPKLVPGMEAICEELEEAITKARA